MGGERTGHALQAPDTKTEGLQALWMPDLARLQCPAPTPLTLIKESHAPTTAGVGCSACPCRLELDVSSQLSVGQPKERQGRWGRSTESALVDQGTLVG